MNKLRFLRIMVALVLFGSTGAIHSETPDEFRMRQRREMDEFRNTQKNKVAAFRDSINREYANFVEQQWVQMQTIRNNRSFLPPPLTFAPRSEEPTPEPAPEPAPELKPPHRQPAHHPTAT